MYFQHSAKSKDDYQKNTGMFFGTDDRCNTFLIASKDGIYGRPGIMRLADDGNYDDSRAGDVRVTYAEYMRNGSILHQA